MKIAKKKKGAKKSQPLDWMLTPLQYLVVKLLVNSGTQSGPAIKHALQEHGAKTTSALRKLVDNKCVISQKKGTIVFRGRAITENEYTVTTWGCDRLKKSQEFYKA